jgi:glycosyltransferase involved in cell wall biosynthesis
MKVLHVQSGTLMGGIQRMLITLARERKHCPELEQHFALCSDAELAKRLRELGVEVPLLGNVRSRYPWQVLRARWRLAGLCRALKPDAVILHGSRELAQFGPVVHRCKIPLIHWMHNNARPDNMNVVERAAGRTRPTHVICNSQFTAESLPILFNPVPPFSVLHCPVSPPPDAPASSNLREEFHTPPDVPVIIQVGRLQPWKGHKLHLAALSHVREPFVLWIVGGPLTDSEAAYEKELRQLVRSLGLEDRVRFTGQRQDVYALLKAADIFCQPNLDGEPFGIVFIEALYCGLPVITTNQGAAPEIINTRCGFLVPPNDAPALATVLRRCITDPKLRRVLRNAAPARAAAISNPAMILTRLGEILSQAVAEH